MGSIPNSHVVAPGAWTLERHRATAFDGAADKPFGMRSVSHGPRATRSLPCDVSTNGQSRCTHMQKTITMAAAREWQSDQCSSATVVSRQYAIEYRRPAKLETPKSQSLSVLLPPGWRGHGGGGSSAARADALIVSLLVLPTPTHGVWTPHGTALLRV